MCKQTQIKYIRHDPSYVAIYYLFVLFMGCTCKNSSHKFVIIIRFIMYLTAKGTLGSIWVILLDHKCINCMYTITKWVLMFYAYLKWIKYKKYYKFIIT